MPALRTRCLILFLGLSSVSILAWADTTPAPAKKLQYQAFSSSGDSISGLDTGVFRFQDFLTSHCRQEGFAFTGNHGSPSFSLFWKPQEWLLVPDAFGYSHQAMGPKGFAQSNFPLTNLQLGIGGQSITTFGFLHERNFGKGLYIRANLQNQRSVGNFKNQSTRVNNFEATTRYATPKGSYWIQLDGFVQRVAANENGGMFPGETPANYPDRLIIPIQLTEARNAWEGNGVFLRQQGKLFSRMRPDSSFSTLHWFLNFHYRETRYRFNDTLPNTDVFPGLRDTLQLKEFLYGNIQQVQPGLLWENRSFKIRVGILAEHRYASQAMQRIQFYNTGVFSVFEWKLPSNWSFSGTSESRWGGLISGQQELNLCISRRVFWHSNTYAVGASAHMGLTPPNWYFLRNETNLQSWQETLPNASHTRFGFWVGKDAAQRWLQVDLLHLSQVTTLNSAAMPQVLAPVSALVVKTRKDWQGKHLVAAQSACWQTWTGPGSELGWASWYLHGLLAYQFNVLKGNSPLQIGTEVTCYGRRAAMRFNPVNGLFYPGGGTLPVSLVADAFFAIKIRRARVFVRMDNVFNSPNNPQLVSGYLLQARQLMLGTTWTFLD
jgi:hypothetical protein